MARTRVVIQSRLNSTRLPGKALLSIAGMPLIELVARRASRLSHEVVVATSDEPYDRWILKHLASVGIPVFQGPLDDVLGRFEMACRDLADDDWVIRLTGDNPLADADLVDELLAAMAETDHRYGRVDIDRVPEGIGCEVFHAADLREAADQATDPYDREHVTPWMRRNLGELLWAPEGSPTDIVAYRATVDCLADFDRAKQLFDGVADPVGIGYRPLFERLATLIERQGRMCERFRLPGWELAEVILDADALADTPGHKIRETFASAIARGVTQVHVTHGVGEKAAHTGGDPQLRNRFEIVAALPGKDSLDVELACTRADLGQRAIHAAYVTTLPSTASWESMRAARTAGHVRLLGVKVDSAQDLDAVRKLDGLDFIVGEEDVLAGIDDIATIAASVTKGRPSISAVTNLYDLDRLLAG